MPALLRFAPVTSIQRVVRLWRRARRRGCGKRWGRIYQMGWLAGAACRGFRHVFIVMMLASVALPGPQPSNGTTVTSQQSPPLETLIAWLDDPSTAWAATAWLQQIGQPAMPALLAPGRTKSGPHDRLSPRMLALAKIGDPAIDPIAERLSDILRRKYRPDGAEAYALVGQLTTI
jgi:hypothetical protein